MLVRKRAIENSSFIVQQKLGDPNITVEELRDQLESGNDSIPKKVLYFSASLRGTQQYWAQRGELRAMIQYQISQGNGLPTYFCTGSFAEFHDKPLRQLLESYIFETTGQRLDLNDKSLLFKSVQEHSHIVAKYFDLRSKDYFELVMKPVFAVNAFWYRQEFAKSCGMVHWHGLAWRQDRQPHT
jgi:hypothetical protein